MHATNACMKQLEYALLTDSANIKESDIRGKCLDKRLYR